MSRIVLGLLLLTLIGAAVHVRADDATEARFFDRVGRRHYAAGRWDEALESFLRAQRVAPSARGLYNVALCAELAGETTLAFAAYEELRLRSDVSPELMADADARQRALARTLSLVHVVSDPPGARIFVDDRDQGAYGSTPATIALTAGPHVIELALPDHETAHAAVTASVGERVDAHVVMTPVMGRLWVEVVPATATLTLVRDGAELAVTSGRWTEVPAGPWTLRARAAGYQDEQLELSVLADRDERRALRLRVVPAPRGVLLLGTGDVHARLSVDGELRAETPARLELSAGLHRVTVSADGFADWSGEVRVEEDTPVYVAVPLTPLLR